MRPPAHPASHSQLANLVPENALTALALQVRNMPNDPPRGPLARDQDNGQAQLASDVRGTRAGHASYRPAREDRPPPAWRFRGGAVVARRVAAPSRAAAAAGA